MFGYVKIYKPELKVKDYEAYQGVYCSLCKQIGKDYGQLARLTLNYDFTLLALVRLAFAGECCGFRNSRCSFNPTKKCSQCINAEKELGLAAAAAMIMCCFKVSDDIADSTFLKGIAKRLLKPFFALKRKKAKRLYPELDSIIAQAMDEQKKAESTVGCGVDASAHPSARAMGRLLSLGFEGELGQKLYDFGYLTGRWVYLMDALDDMEEDRENNSYNCFNNANSDEKEARAYAVSAVNLTAGQLVRQYKALEPARFSEIMENIVYDGLYNSMNEVLKKEEKNERSV